jgi:hypothetical protein
MQAEAYTAAPRMNRSTRNAIKRRKRRVRRTVFLLTSVSVVGWMMFCGMTTASEDIDDEWQVQAVVSVEPLVEAQFDVPDEPEDAEEPYSIEQMLEDGYVTNDIALSHELQLVAREASSAFGIPYTLLLAVMFQESSYQTDAVNYNGTCWGLMQVNEINFDRLLDELSEYGVTDIKNDPEDNITAGAFMLGELLEKYQDENMALMCYNCGENGARRLFEQGYYSSGYSRAVIQYAAELDNAGILPNGK